MLNKKQKIISVIGLSVILSSQLVGGGLLPISNFKYYPLNKNLVSKSRGGTLPDNVAIKDGVGTILLNDVSYRDKKLDNSVFNKTLLKYKNKLSNTHNLKDLIQDNIITISENKLNKINSNKFLTNSNTNNTGNTGGSTITIDNGFALIDSNSNSNSNINSTNSNPILVVNPLSGGNINNNRFNPNSSKNCSYYILNNLPMPNGC